MLIKLLLLLTDTEQVDSVQVDGVDPNFELDAPAPAPTPVIEERAPVLATQTQPVTELRVMSQPTTVPDITRVQNYVFEDDPGSGTYIYMVENGINTSPIVSLPHHLHRARSEGSRVYVVDCAI